MEKYKPIRQLMAAGEFRKALDHISRILQKNPDDNDARQLAYTCREMIHIQEACSGAPDSEEHVSANEYFSVHFRRCMKFLCRMVRRLLEKLPETWRQKLKPERLKTWEQHFTVDTDSQKDWLWELLFWNVKRRFILFAALIIFLLAGICTFILLASDGCRQSEALTFERFPAIVKAANSGDAQAQFSLGKSFYYGENVNRDVEQSLLWLTKSARSGYEPAAKLLHKILTEQDIRVQEGRYIWQNNLSEPKL